MGGEKLRENTLTDGLKFIVVEPGSFVGNWFVYFTSANELRECICGPVNRAGSAVCSSPAESSSESTWTSGGSRMTA